MPHTINKKDFFEEIKNSSISINEIINKQTFLSKKIKKNDKLFNQALQNWRRISSKNDSNIFRQRLKKDKIKLKKIASQLFSQTLKRNNNIKWDKNLEWIYESIQNKDYNNFRSKKAVYPFEDLYFNLIETAFLKLYKPKKFKFSKKVKTILLEDLLSKITTITQYALYEEFLSFIKISSNENKKNKNNYFYKLFTDYFRSNYIEKFFRKYPVLLRLLSTIVSQWLDSNNIFLKRLEKDSYRIFKQLNFRANIISNIDISLSDPHNYGKSVYKIQNSSGKIILYKPKSLKTDYNFSKLIGKINNLNPPEKLMLPKVLSFNNYGWTEYIHHKACKNLKDFNSYYRKAGSWLGILYLYSATDFHAENIIAYKNFPVPIDFETIMQPSFLNTKRKIFSKSVIDANLFIDDSVNSVGMLPNFSLFKDNKKVYDNSGLKGGRSSYQTKIWKNVNKDDMYLKKILFADPPNKNLPFLKSKTGNFNSYVDEFINGFKNYLNFIIRLREKFGNNLFLKDFKKIDTRVVIRPTRFYYLLLERLKNHKYMNNGILWSLNSDFVTRLSNFENKIHINNWKIHNIEREDLLDFNIPYLKLSFFNSNIQNKLFKSLRDKLNNLNDKEIKTQSSIIEQLLSLVKKKKEKINLNHKKLLLKKYNFSKKNFFENEAHNIYQKIISLAFKDKNNLSWVGINWLGESNVGHLSNLDPYIYNGNLGIAIFLEAYGKVFKNKNAKKYAYKSVRNIIENIKMNHKTNFLQNQSIGGLVGLGSLIYGFCALYNISKKRIYLNTSLSILKKINLEQINKDKSLDILDGVSGLILSLIYMNKVIKDPIIKKVLEHCGDYLINQPMLKYKGYKSWKSISISSNLPLTGMSHGASGFALALYSLYNLIPKKKYYECLRDCFNYEDNFFDKKKNNWLDLRGFDNLNPNQWCHGAVGIGFSRLSMIKIKRKKLLINDLEKAINSSLNAWPNIKDTICCGKMSTILFLYDYSKFTKNNEIKNLAIDYLYSTIKLSKINKGYNLGAKYYYNPGLFLGLSGIGYVILNFLDNDLPNIQTLS